MNRIAIIITTFNRDELLANTVANILNYWNPDYRLFIGDQSPNDGKTQLYADFMYYDLPYDCGLSYSRNFLVQKAYDMGFKYVLLSADSIQFTQECDFRPIINFLESNQNYGVVGFELLNSKCPWEYYLEKKDNALYYIKSNDYFTYNNINFKKVDICRNIFLAKTEIILNLWDNEQKLSEHTLAFWNLKQKGYKVFWTDFLTFNRFTNQNNPEYDKYRKRTGEYRKLAYKKLGIENRIFIK
jgi:GT2 family glycosyltransferase